MSSLSEARVLQYELELSMRASRARVWEMLTAETNAWWLTEFDVVGPDSVVTLDARAGGHLLEQERGGGSLIWYSMQMCLPGRSLHLVGHLAPGWGGPATTMLELILEDDGDGTRLIVRDAVFGKVSEEGVRSLAEGWTRLFGEGLRTRVEA